MKKYLFFIPFLLLLPSWALAAHHNWVCADLASMTVTGVTCSSDVFTFATGNHMEDPHAVYPIPSTTGLDYYASYTQVGTGRMGVTIGGDNAGTAYQSVNGSASATDLHFVTVAGNTANTVGFQFYTAGGGSTCGGSPCDFSGTVSSLCTSDTIGECAPPPAPPEAAIGTSTPVDSAASDLFYGVLLFVIGFWGMIWFFRKSR